MNDSISRAYSRPFVSVVIPVKNGAGRLENCLASLQTQTYPREQFEIVVADGRSRDATVEIARSFGCVVVDNPRETVAGGRNAGLTAARGTLIAFTEDDMILPNDWLANGVLALDDAKVDAIGGPTPIPETSKPFSRAIEILFRYASAIGYSVQSDVGQQFVEVTDIPGGNAMYRRNTLTGVAVDESFVTGEDVDMHIRMRAAGSRLFFVPAFSAWHHKRDSPKRFFHQIRRFAQGRVQLNRRHPGAMRPLHWATSLALPVFTLLSVAATRIDFPLILIASAAICAGSIGFAKSRSLATACWLPAVCAVFLTAWTIGVFRELFAPTRDATGK